MLSCLCGRVEGITLLYCPTIWAWSNLRGFLDRDIETWVYRETNEQMRRLVEEWTELLFMLPPPPLAAAAEGNHGQSHGHDSTATDTGMTPWPQLPSATAMDMATDDKQDPVDIM